MKDFWDSFKLQISERLSNPLLGSFVISWLVWNHRMVFVLFADMSAKERFDFIDRTLYPTWWVSWFCLLIGPLACSLLYIRFYPDVAKRINGFWLREQNELKKQRDEIEGATLLTKEESLEIRKLAYEQVRDVEKENLRLRDQLQALTKSISEDDKPKDAAKPVKDPYESQRQEIERRKIEIETAESDVKWHEAQERRRKALGATSDDPLDRLPEGTRKLLKHMAEKAGSITRDEAKDLFKTESAVRAESYIDQALEFELVTEGASTGTLLETLHLTSKGRKYIVSRKLA